MTMRILGGSMKGRRLPDHATWVRPTSAYRREMIFNRLRHSEGFESFEGKRVLDAFAGTGSLGFEAASRGAAHVTFAEKNPHTFKALRTFPVHPLHVEQFTFLQTNATHMPLSTQAVDLCFLDAPYHKDLIPPALASLRAQGWLKTNTLCVAETDINESLTLPSWIIPTEKRGKGRTFVHFWRVYGIK